MEFPKRLEDIEQYLHDHELKAGKGYSLERMQTAVERLGHPERKFKVIHVGGTSGKGSTCTFIGHILEAAGYSVGLSVSPSLISPLERIQINGKPIREQTALKLLREMWPLILELKLSYFETFTLLTFQYFAERQVDYGVIEVGMGGKYDATNVVQPTVAIVTEVGLDHTEILGPTKAIIAKDKQEIIKPGCIGLTGSRYIKRGTYIDLDQAKIHDVSLHGVTFSYRRWKHLQMTSPATYQVRNAVLAIEATSRLGVGSAAIQFGLKQVQQRGRFEIVSHKPLVIADGAHNPQKMTAFVQALKQLVPLKQHRVVALCTVKSTKDLKATLKPLLPYVDEMILTTSPYSYSLKQLEQVVRKLKPRLTIRKLVNPQAAYQLFRESVQADDIGLITGSLYLIGELLPLL